MISRSGPGTGSIRYRLQPPETVHVGRSTSNNLVLPDPGVSRDHATLEWNDHDDGTGHWRVSDLASSSGTRVNGVPLLHFRSLRLEPGDRVDFGPVAMEFLMRAPDAGTSTIHSRCDDTPPAQVEPVEPAALSAQQLEAVLEASHRIHLSATEEAVYECAVNSLVKATGFPDIAFVRPAADSAEVRVLAAAGGAAERRFSRTVLRRARAGPVLISDPRTQGMTIAGTLAGTDMARVICVPVQHNEDFFGLLYLSDRGKIGVKVEALASLVQSVAGVSALALSNLLRIKMSQRLEAEQRSMFDGTMQALIATIDAKDPYTRGHSARVADYATLLARALGLPAEECERIRLCGLVHDIGKIGVSEAILRKSDQLSEAEFRVI
ncbi:MAG: FHA domain-containing protein, partial [Phycisphaerae bacterium]|nr:FHA domain-containing protein [Phycisphaerae bacterium]